MKSTLGVSISGVLGLIFSAPSVVPFAPKHLEGRMLQQQQPLRTAAGAGDVPDIVQEFAARRMASATGKAKVTVKATSAASVAATPSLPDLSNAQETVDNTMDTVVESVKSVGAETAEKSKSILTEFMKNAKLPETVPRAPLGDVPSVGEMVRRAKFAESAPLAEGKAKSLAGFIKDGVIDPAGAFQASQAATDGTLSNAKAKFALMVSNTYNLFGKDPPENFPAALSGIASDASNGLLQMRDNVSSGQLLSDGTTGWAVAAFALLVAAGQRNAGVSDARSSMDSMVQEEAKAFSNLAGEVKNMGDEINNLNLQTKDLAKELTDAKTKLTKKELEISKERLKVADKELILNREIEKLQSQLRESNQQVKDMETELKETQKMKQQLTDSLENVKGLEVDLDELGAAAAAATQAEAKPKGDEPFFAEKPKPKKKATKAKAVKAPAVKKKLKGSTKVVEAAKKESKAKKGTTKATTKATKATNEVDDEDWSSFTKSTLSRKTVKDLTTYLDAKGIKTTDDDGKVLKKADLVDAVLSG